MPAVGDEQGPAPPPRSEAVDGGGCRRGQQHDHEHPEDLPLRRAITTDEERQGNGDGRHRRQAKQGGEAPVWGGALRHVRQG
jgi:hypothetical protein